MRAAAEIVTTVEKIGIPLEKKRDDRSTVVLQSIKKWRLTKDIPGSHIRASFNKHLDQPKVPEFSSLGQCRPTMTILDFKVGSLCDERPSC
jgi:hypothetical protein